MSPDIFTSFDPHSLFSFRELPAWFWTLIILPLTPFLLLVWPVPSKKNTLTSSTLNNLLGSILSKTKTPTLPPAGLFLTTTFIVLLLINFLGMAPNIFSFSSHPTITLSLSLPLWLITIISSSAHSPKKSAASLLPTGAPPWLSPPLILIETISIFVRPLTLGVRLAANMSAGHIILALMSKNTSSTMFTISPLGPTGGSLLQAGYTAFELGICLIQAFIFFLLLTLYTSDHSA